jgi:hypothetical protein
MGINKNEIEKNAELFRLKMGLNTTEAIDVKSILRKKNILTIYLPMSQNACGLSLQSSENDKFILVNSMNPKGRQHFTIAHELFHLYYDENPKPHICLKEGNSTTEKAANYFAASLLMPKEGIVNMISEESIFNNQKSKKKGISLSTVLRLEQYFRVSRTGMLFRLRDLGFLGQEKYEEFKCLSPIKTAREYGYDETLYKNGNKYMTIGDYGEKARKLYEEDIISEGHYEELLNKIQRWPKGK